ncbi:uncharacterized protein LOC114969239 [Acropora millepora]|uniref:uncharacterized protein LOC114969239 n=1 Tax=Acropora millepora TaxID=45264 RepID=UPI001CF1CED8|nr:uncharacterized protein LOC114969239 [Acropora millepora]
MDWILDETQLVVSATGDLICGSLIFDVVLKFTTEVAEDDTISIIQNAIVDGKIGELSVNASCIIGIPRFPRTTTTAPTSTTPKSDGNKTGLIVGVVLGSVAFVALIIFIVWCVRKKKCCSETKEVSDKNADAGQGRKGKGQNGGDEAAYASTSMLPHSKRPVEKTNQGTVQALPMYAQVDKTKKTSNKGGAAQRQPGELNYAQVEHVTSGRSLPRKSSSEPIKPSNEEIVYADLV